MTTDEKTEVKSAIAELLAILQAVGMPQQMQYEFEARHAGLLCELLSDSTTKPRVIGFAPRTEVT